jgi:hypothetical protein
VTAPPAFRVSSPLEIEVPRLTAAGKALLVARFAMALELDPPGERALTAAQKTAYRRWLTYYLGA